MKIVVYIPATFAEIIRVNFYVKDIVADLRGVTYEMQEMIS